MSILWLISYIGLWIIVIVLGLTVLALIREVEQIHKKYVSLIPYFLKLTNDKVE